MPRNRIVISSYRDGTAAVAVERVQDGLLIAHVRSPRGDTAVVLLNADQIAEMLTIATERTPADGALPPLEGV